MSNQLPVKNLVILNWIMTFASSFLLFIILLTVTKDVFVIYTRSLEILALMAILTFGNLYIRMLYAKSGLTSGSFSKWKFYLSSYLYAIVAFVFVIRMYILFTGVAWEGSHSAIPWESYLFAFFSIMLFNSLVLFLQNILILQHNKVKTEMENLQLKTNISESSNLLLRQQIHPHFLFNALNTVKSLYKKDLQEGEAYLIHLANFLRVSISNQTTKTTLIKSELAFCMDYLKMQQIRFGIALDYTIDISEEARNTLSLPFFSLQPLVENVLKHNELTEDRPIHITIREKDGYIYVINNLQERSHKETSTGQGLLNLAEQYKLLGEESIYIESDEQNFTVKIKIIAP